MTGAANQDYFAILDAPRVAPGGVLRLGVRRETFARLIHRHRRTMIAQYYGNVRQLHMAAHVFRGVNRDLMFGDNADGDQDILIYSWKPQHEFLWIGGAFNGTAVPVPAPQGRVFVVLARKLPAPDGEVGATALHWNWVEEGKDPEAPVDWQERYTERLWSKAL